MRSFKNLEKYCEFLVIENVNAAVAKYLNEKSYSQEIGNIIINALSNATSTAAFIYTKSKSNEFLQTIFIEPRIEVINGEIHLLKRAEHYELIVVWAFTEIGEVEVVEVTKKISLATLYRYLPIFE